MITKNQIDFLQALHDEATQAYLSVDVPPSTLSTPKAKIDALAELSEVTDALIEAQTKFEQESAF